jgi:hypothetical protein
MAIDSRSAPLALRLAFHRSIVACSSNAQAMARGRVRLFSKSAERGHEAVA